MYSHQHWWSVRALGRRTGGSRQKIDEVPMRQYDASNLIVHPGGSADQDVIMEVTPELAGWDYIHFQVRRLQLGHSWQFATGEHELALVVLSGSIAVESNLGHWPRIGERQDVFAGPPAALFL